MGQVTPEQWSNLLAQTKWGRRMNTVGALDPTLNKMGLPETGRNATFYRQTPDDMDPQARGGPIYTSGRLPSIEDMFKFYLDFIQQGLQPTGPMAKSFPGLQMPKGPTLPGSFNPLEPSLEPPGGPGSM